jgi:hypothetical protein
VRQLREELDENDELALAAAPPTQLAQKADER